MTETPDRFLFPGTTEKPDVEASELLLRLYNMDSHVNGNLYRNPVMLLVPNGCLLAKSPENIVICGETALIMRRFILRRETSPDQNFDPSNIDALPEAIARPYEDIVLEIRIDPFSNTVNIYNLATESPNELIVIFRLGNEIVGFEFIDHTSPGKSVDPTRILLRYTNDSSEVPLSGAKIARTSRQLVRVESPICQECPVQRQCNPYQNSQLDPYRQVPHRLVIEARN